MADKKTLPTAAFAMSEADVSNLHQLAKDVQADFAGEWSQNKCALTGWRFLVDNNLIDDSDENKKRVLPLLNKLSNSSALRQAVFETKAEKSKLAVDYSQIA